MKTISFAGAYRYGRFKYGALPFFRRFQRHQGIFRGFSTLRPTINELLEHPPTAESIVTTQGHIKSIRQFKKVGFIDICDGTCYRNMSVVVQDPQTVMSGVDLRVGQSIEVRGKWAESPGEQRFELVYDPGNELCKLEIVGGVRDDYELQKKSQTFQFLRGLPVLRHRTSTLASVVRFRSVLEMKMAEFFHGRGFCKVAPPIITSSDCEGAGEQFMVEAGAKSCEGGATAVKKTENFFDKPASLTVSTQLHLELLASSLNRVWTLTPCFRAEDSNTNRHLSEFWMLEAEMCYVDSVHQLTAFTEEMIREVVGALNLGGDLPSGGPLQDLLGSRYNSSDIQKIILRWKTLTGPEKWPSITYIEALDIINKVKNQGNPQHKLNWGDSIQTEHEKWLAGSHFHSPVFITDYPLDQKPFYMKKSYSFDPAKPTVACYDLILPEIGELVGGSLREHDYNTLLQELELRNMNKHDLWWYLANRMDGTVPHGGFGLGFERLVAYLTAMDNIKDVIPFPRVPHSCPC